MIDLLKDIDLSELITITISFGAILIAIISIVISVRLNNKQILNGKYEEILELVFNLSYHYSQILFIYNQLAEAHNEKYEAKERLEWLKTYRSSVDSYKRGFSEKKLDEYISRLSLLSKSYIKDDELRKELVLYADVFEKIIVVSLGESMMHKSMFYPDGFPSEIKLNDYIEKLESKIIKLIGFSNEVTPSEQYRVFRETNRKRLVD